MYDGRNDFFRISCSRTRIFVARADLSRIMQLSRLNNTPSTTRCDKRTYKTNVFEIYIQAGPGKRANLK